MDTFMRFFYRLKRSLILRIWIFAPKLFFYNFTALEKLREEFKADSESLAHSEAISILSYDD